MRQAGNSSTILLWIITVIGISFAAGVIEFDTQQLVVLEQCLESTKEGR